jgi:hypothetical protein
LTSDATAAKPSPTSPARETSMVALSARRFVCDAVVEMRPITEPMRATASSSEQIACCVRRVSATVVCVICRSGVAYCLMCSIDCESSSVAAPAASTCCEVSAAAGEADAMPPMAASELHNCRVDA